jgi:hypothetical protein
VRVVEPEAAPGAGVVVADAAVPVRVAAFVCRAAPVGRVLPEEAVSAALGAPVAVTVLVPPPQPPRSAPALTAASALTAVSLPHAKVLASPRVIAPR